MPLAKGGSELGCSAGKFTHNIKHGKPCRILTNGAVNPSTKYRQILTNIGWKAV